MLASRNRQLPGDSVDHDLRLKADHRLRRAPWPELGTKAQSSRPRLGCWTVVQRGQLVIY